MNPIGKPAAYTLGATLIFAAGMALGWKLRMQEKRDDPKAPEIRQTDGSLVLKRDPVSTLKPQQIIPRGAKVERVVQVVFTPSPEAMAPICGHDRRGADYPLPAMVLDLTLVRSPDGSQRVIASSPDGTVEGGVDVPVQPGVLPRVPKWSGSGLVGWDYVRGQRAYGFGVSYGSGPFTVQTGILGPVVFAGIGIRW